MKKTLASIAAAAIMLAAAVSPAADYMSELRQATMALDRAEDTAGFLVQAKALESVRDRAAATDMPLVLTELARAYYLAGESEKGEKLRTGHFDKALDASAGALELEPGNTHALYWRSMSQLHMADIKGGIAALNLVNEALAGLEAVCLSDGIYDFAGAYRSRGKVLVEAPFWSFIGDAKKGVMLLEKARELAPDALINRLYLAEAYVETGKAAKARAELAFIAKAPLGELKPGEDEKIKKDAEKLLAELDKERD